MKSDDLSIGENEMNILTICSNFIEVVLVIVLPFYLYRWEVGVLVSSGLTSLLHIVYILKMIEKKL